MGFSFELAVFGTTIAVFIIMGFLLYYFAQDYRRSLLGKDGESMEKAQSNTILSRMSRELSFAAFFMDDSKSIGIRYLITSLALFFIGGLAGIGMRLSLWFPNPTFLSPIQYNILLTAHGTIMLYGWALGSILGISYYLLPSVMKIRNDSLGILNSTFYWMFLTGAILIIFSKSTASWYFYYPLVDQLTEAGGGTFSYATLIGVMLTMLAAVGSSIIFLKMIFMDRDRSIKLSSIP
ncbi:MAG: cbb3-type cytochrome c oxidase subunit I, partial [Thermoplasmatales archaeon]